LVTRDEYDSRIAESMAGIRSQSSGVVAWSSILRADAPHLPDDELDAL